MSLHQTWVDREWSALQQRNRERAQIRIAEIYDASLGFAFIAVIVGFTAFMAWLFFNS